ncbi:MAG: L-rhamnose isomerase [Opitutales bacterium]|nr:L-rhamnose isomerase [Opitutales bacterium]
MTPLSQNIYALARERYASAGIDTEAALETLARVPLSLHCWQGDDVTGFEGAGSSAGSGCLATGNYPGKARNFDELSADLDAVARLIPGPLRLNLHAIYATDNAAKVDRDALTAEHFSSWIDWASERKWGIDFNPTCFAHRLATDGFTLAHRDPAVRRFWVDHCIASRRIGAEIGAKLGDAVVTNIWIPDGFKDTPADRAGPRRRLLQSLEEIFAAHVSKKWNIDTVESKLFGIGVESYTVGSHEFYLAFAVKNQVGLCLDAGHFHPTESVADKISAVLPFIPHLLLHVSRGVRWDSDHVVTLDDPTRDMLAEVANPAHLPHVSIGMDFFDASINRLAAWAIGARNTRKALLLGLLRPRAALCEAEERGDHTARLALLEDARTLPWNLVWDEFCRRADTPLDGAWLSSIRDYEKSRGNRE